LAGCALRFFNTVLLCAMALRILGFLSFTPTTPAVRLKNNPAALAQWRVG
jgi:hypothetical protein